MIKMYELAWNDPSCKALLGTANEDPGGARRQEQKIDTDRNHVELSMT
jgi:hypothetical protein